MRRYNLPYGLSGPFLSVPFSSGFALRPVTSASLPRSTPPLSVPFSSGFALRRYCGETKVGKSHSFSSLFLGIRFATPRCCADGSPGRACFQFPFPRDSLCDPICFAQSLIRCITFSSLFLGIRFATLNQVVQQISADRSFSSLFLGIRFATRTVELSTEFECRSFSSLFLGIRFATPRCSYIS